MNDGNALGLGVLGGAVVTGALGWRAMRTSVDAQHTTAPIATPSATAWSYPVPDLGARRAVISNRFHAAQHLGVDLMFPRRDARDLISVYPPGSRNGSRGFFMPDDVPAFAVSNGVVTFAAMTPVGNAVIVKHDHGWATYYAHLATLTVIKGQVVATGQMLGTIGASPTDGEHLQHLHLELWNGGTRAGAIDPHPFLAAWSHRAITNWAPQALIASSSTVRNGTMSGYRPIGASGDRYPEWLRALRGVSGVYVIREKHGPIVYVGSSVGRLYDTLTRHFQVWRRFKGFWRGQFAEGADPGLTYKRSAVEVAIKLTKPDEAHDEELRAIRRLRPRDNQLGQAEPDTVPF